MVVTFNNELEVAQRVILSWQERALLKSVTVIRDVFGKLSFLLESTSYPEEEGRNTLEQLVQGNLQGYYGGNFTGKICQPNRGDIYNRCLIY